MKIQMVGESLKYPNEVEEFVVMWNRVNPILRLAAECVKVDFQL